MLHESINHSLNCKLYTYKNIYSVFYACLT